MVLVFWSFCIKAKGHTTDANGNKLRKEVDNDSIVLSGPLVEKEYRARFIATDGQPTALDSTMLLAQDSIVFKPGFHAQPGMRLTAKIDSTIAPVDQTDYIAGIEYRNNQLLAIYHTKGRAVPDSTAWRHEYVITDHLGNTRLRFSDLDGNTQIDSTELLSTHDYYPFGLEWQDGGYKYTYNGKEIDRELGLNWHHYGKRMYDAVLGRFTGVDPISDQFPWVSTFNYAENEPVANIDLHGLQRIGYDVRFDVEARQTLSGEQSPEEFKAFLRAEGQGALLGISLVSPVDEITIGVGLLTRTSIGRTTVSFLAKAGGKLSGLLRGSRKGIEEFTDQALSRDEMAGVFGRGPSNPFMKKSIEELESDQLTFQNLIEEHKQKLSTFLEDPIGNSGEAWLRQATKDNPSEEVLFERAMGRVPALEKQIKKQEGELAKIQEAIKAKSGK